MNKKIVFFAMFFAIFAAGSAVAMLSREQIFKLSVMQPKDLGFNTGDGLTVSDGGWTVYEQDKVEQKKIFQREKERSKVVEWVIIASGFGRETDLEALENLFMGGVDEDLKGTPKGSIYDKKAKRTTKISPYFLQEKAKKRAGIYQNALKAGEHGIYRLRWLENLQHAKRAVGIRRKEVRINLKSVYLDERVSARQEVEMLNGVMALLEKERVLVSSHGLYPTPRSRMVMAKTL